jgi:PAS domain S-box-containing protein
MSQLQRASGKDDAELLRLLVESVTDYAIFLLDPQGNVASWNPGAERIKGYRAEEIIGQHFSRFYPQDAIDRDWPAHELLVAEMEGRFEDEGWRIRKDGSHFWANVVITALRDEHGDLRGYAKITRDLTQRKEAEESARCLVAETTARRVAEENARAIQLQRERLRVTLESIGDGVISTDERGRVEFLNPVAQYLVGWTNDEAAQRDLTDIFHIVNEATRRPVENPAIRALKEGLIVGLANHTVLISKDGTERPIDDSAAPIRDADGQLVGTVLVFRDISERKRNEARLRVQQEWLRVTLASIGDAVIATDTDGKVTFLNPVAEALTGWRQADAQGKNLDVIFPIANEQTGQSIENPVARVLRDGMTVGLGNHTILTARDGARRPIDDSAAPILDAAGNLIGVVLTFRDVTETRRKEQALRDSDRRKDEFLAILAHELRNPLAPIRNSLEILKLPRVDPDTSRQTRDMIERQVHHLVRLVDDLLDVSRVMKSKIELRREPVELATVVARAAETVQSLIDVQGHTLEIAVPNESLLLDADPVRLAQVVGNLLTNAAKYTEANGRIWLTVRREGDEAALSLRDTGIGIAPDMLPHVFELFVQADHSSTKAHGGLGIGLTLVKNLVEMHGGSVEAHSAGLGQGSEFVVRLPLLSDREQSAAADRRKGPTQAAPATGMRLLVVDDNSDAAMSLAMLLRLQGHDVKVAHDGLTALETATRFRPDVIFLDIGMPGMDGYEVARRLRERPGLEHVVLAALTGWGQEEDRRRTARAGFNHHLVKPPEPKDLESVLTDLKRPPSGGRTAR